MKNTAFFYRLFCLGLFVLSFFSCRKDDSEYIYDPGTGYYPLQVGKYIEYQVDSTIFDPNGAQAVLVSRTLMREVAVDTVFDNLGQVLIKMERYERASIALPWQVKKVFTQSVDNRQAIRQEDNLRFIIMAFPLTVNDSWDGTAAFHDLQEVNVAGETLEMFKGWESKILSLDVPEQIGSFEWPEVLTIRQADSENLIEKRYSIEKYSRNLGLVYRELWILDTQCIEACEGQTWEEKAGKGFILKQTIISHN